MAVTAGIALVCFFGGVLSGLAGFGALIIMVPALVLLVGMAVTIPLGVLCGVATQGMNVWFYRSHVHKQALFRLLLGSLPGIWIGGSLLIYLPEPILRAMLGTLIVGYVCWSFRIRKLPCPTGEPAAIWAYVAGFFCGGFGAAFGINGPPAVIYATRTNWTPAAIRAFVGIFCFLLFIITAGTMITRGIVTPEVWRLAALAIPCCLAGSLCGRRIAARLNPAQYMKLVFLLLLVMGLSLCWPAFRLYIL